MANRRVKKETVTDFIFLGSKITADSDCSHEITRHLLLGRKVKVKVTQSYPTLCYPMDYTVHGILQARILEWVAFPFSRGSSQPRDQTQVSCIAGRFFTNWPIKSMTNLDSILKSKDITLPAVVRIVKTMAFPIVMYWCESWTIKKAEQMLSNCGAREDSWESLGQQGDQASQS